MLLGAVVLAGKAEEFKQKGTPPRIHRVIAQFSAKRLNRRPKLSGVVEFSGCHGSGPRGTVQGTPYTAGRRLRRVCCGQPDVRGTACMPVAPRHHTFLFAFTSHPARMGPPCAFPSAPCGW